VGMKGTSKNPIDVVVSICSKSLSPIQERTDETAGIFRRIQAAREAAENARFS
jgi:hypothetical protein